MFVVRVSLKIQSSHGEAFRAYAASEGLEPRKLPGCVEYSFCEDLAEPLRVLLYEEWASRPEFEAYKASSFFAATGTRLRGMLAEPPRSAYYESDDVFAACALR
jgi:quinol monooxygenase YgiN